MCYCTGFALFYFEFERNFQVQVPGVLGFFALRVWGAYIWRGSYMEELTYGILRYLIQSSLVYFVVTLVTQLQRWTTRVQPFFQKGHP